MGKCSYDYSILRVVLTRGICIYTIEFNSLGVVATRGKATTMTMGSNTGKCSYDYNNLLVVVTGKCKATLLPPCHSGGARPHNRLSVPPPPPPPRWLCYWLPPHWDTPQPLTHSSITSLTYSIFAKGKLSIATIIG
jgi:hypothetical protein